MDAYERAAQNVHGGVPQYHKPCLYCVGRGKRLHDPRRDGQGMKPAGPFRCPDCGGKGYVPMGVYD